MANHQYLKQRGQQWYLQKRVRKSVAGLVDISVVQIPLGTSDIKVAQKLRWKQLAELDEQWDRLENPDAITPEQVEEAAHQEFHRTLKDAEKQKYDVESLGLLLGEIAAEHGDPAGEHGTNYQINLGEIDEAMMWARVDAYNARIAALEARLYRARDFYGRRGVNPVSLRPVKPRRVPALSSGLRISEAAGRYVAERQRDVQAKLNDQNLGHHETSYRLFKDFMRDATLADVARSDASGFLHELGKLDKRWGRSKGDGDLTLEQLIQKYPAEEGKPLSNRTINRHTGSLISLFRWARNRGYFEGENPFSDQARMVPKRSVTTYKSYTIDDLNALFGSEPWSTTPRNERIKPKPYTFKNAFMWVPLIGVFTGARSGEICQLMKHDIEERDGIPLILIRAEAEHQSVKSEAGVRVVPIHSELVKLGFLEYVENVPDGGQLFPALKAKGRGGKLNKYFGGRYSDHLVKIGIKRERLSFHSFRTNVGTALENAGVAENVINQVIGHEKSTISLTTYSEGITKLEILRDAVEKIEYPELNLGHLYA